MRHTPGPWRYAGERVYEQQTDDVIAQPGRNFSAINPSQTLEANARLIAAAPTMLTELQDMVAEYDAVESFDSAMDAADMLTDFVQRMEAAINKATGNA